MSHHSDAAPDTPSPARLAELRAEIDAIDAEIHARLRARAAVIDDLIAAKGPTLSAGAFRPGREALMMRRIAERHSGSLPIVTIEHLWREIIGTFTYLQAPYRAHVGELAAPDGSMRDVARFTVGFAVPLVAAADAAAAVAGVVADPRDLAIVPIGAAEGPEWWAPLAMDGPRVMARLPFFDLPGRTAGRPAVVISAAVADEGPPEVACLAAAFAVPPTDAQITGSGFAILGRSGSRFLLARSGAAASAAALLAAAGGTDIRAAGGYAAPLALSPPSGAPTEETRP